MENMSVILNRVLKVILIKANRNIGTVLPFWHKSADLFLIALHGNTACPNLACVIMNDVRINDESGLSYKQDPEYKLNTSENEIDVQIGEVILQFATTYECILRRRRKRL